MQCKNPQAFSCSATQIRKDYPTAQQAIYLFSARSHLLSSPNIDRTNTPPRFTKGCTNILNVTKILKTLL